MRRCHAAMKRGVSAWRLQKCSKEVRILEENNGLPRCNVLQAEIDTESLLQLVGRNIID